MGIKRFTSRVLHKGERETFCCTDDREPGQSLLRSAYIDGPSFAHHVYRIAVREAHGRELCYEELNRIVLDHLKRLEDHGFAIRHIYFDGALPEEKISVRHARLQHNIDQLELVRHKYEIQARTAERTSLVDFIQHARYEGRLHAPPFMVGAMIDTLSETNYAVEVVPGEAEAYCIAAAAQQEACSVEATRYIFTDDSDAIALTSSKHTRIVLLNHMKYGDADEAAELKALVFHPIGIAQQHGLDHLRLVASIMQNDLHVTLEVACGLAQSKAVGLPTALAMPDPALEWQQVASCLKDSMRFCNPRLSEVFFALHSSNGAINMYLPSLFEDTSRTSAWQVSRPFRQLAATILLLNRPGRMIRECDRRATNLNEIQLKPNVDLETASKEVSMWLASALTLCEEAARSWQSVAIMAVLDALKASTRSMPRASDSEHVLRGRQPQTWAQIHLLAQLQGVLWSLTILRAALDHHYYCSTDGAHRLTSSTSHETSDQLEKLRTILSKLPQSRKLFDRSIVEPRQAVISRIKVLCREAGSKGQSTASGSWHIAKPKPSRSKRRLDRAEFEKLSTAPSQSTSSNPYAALLALEEASDVA